MTQIESALSPCGAVVISPDRLRDKITGEMREVDASIRFRIGSVEVLIIIECRERSRVEDVTWIEQLATKKQHVAAAHVIAVSSKAFSRPALQAAERHGIAARTVTEVTEAQILTWLDTLVVEEVDTTLALGKLALEFDGGQPAPVDPESERLWLEQAWDAAIFIDRRSDIRLSLADLLARVVRERGKPIAGRTESLTVTVPPGGSTSLWSDPLSIIVQQHDSSMAPSTKTHTVVFEGEDIAIDTDSGIRKLRKILFEATASATRRRIPLTRALSYATGEGQVIANVGERVIDIHNGRSLELTYYKKPTPGR